MLKAVAFVAIAAGPGTAASSTPLMYIRIVVPSYVTAAWIHVPSVGYVVTEFTRYVSPDVAWLKRANTCCGEDDPDSVARESEYPSMLPNTLFETMSCVAT